MGRRLTAVAQAVAALANLSPAQRDGLLGEREREDAPERDAECPTG